MLLIPLLLGCAVTDLYVVDVQAEVESALDGPVYAELAYATWGTGELETPYQPIVEIELDGPGSFEQTLELDLSLGDGVALYAWQDLDGDGEHCAPGSDDEPAGLVVAEDWPSHELELIVELDTPCAGPESLIW